MNRRWMLAIGVVVAALGALALAVAARVDDDGSDAGDTADRGLTATFELLDGGTGSFEQYRGTPLVVNFFASWCVPCLAEMPGFERVHQDLDGQVAFLGLNLQDRVEDGQRVVDQTGITYDVGRDPDGTLFEAFGGFAMPTTVFVDADGNVVELHSGEISAGALRDRIDELLLS